MHVLNQLEKSFQSYTDRNAFCLNSIYYTYADLKNAIAAIRAKINAVIPSSQKQVGLMAYDDLHTYASIFALWYEKKAYVPLQPLAPKERNLLILQQTEGIVVLSSNASEKALPAPFAWLNTSSPEQDPASFRDQKLETSDLAYILFTSGSTGMPKGVPITHHNLSSLFKAMAMDPDHKIYPEDRCLQMFELTFDYSLVTFLTPLLYGACIYTIPRNQIKYMYLYKLIVEKQLTYLVMVPSVIHFLRDYFHEIRATAVRYCCFGAAPLHLDILEEWLACVPNAKVFNSYGPTEFTVTATYYPISKTKKIHNRNGVISLGKTLDGIQEIIVDADLNEVPDTQEGELCLSGTQITAGYWKLPEKNAQAFFTKTKDQKSIRFYKTGDLCVRDAFGYLLFVGRKDFQVKIRGYRVELSEIEIYTKSHLPNTNIKAIAVRDKLGNSEIALAIQKEDVDKAKLLAFLKKKLPDYMIPTQVQSVKEFPLNANGKIDRKQLIVYFSKLINQ